MFAPSQFAKSIDDEALAKYKIQLDQRIGLIEGGLGGLGVSMRVLEQDELYTMFNEYYNPVKIMTTGTSQQKS